LTLYAIILLKKSQVTSLLNYSLLFALIRYFTWRYPDGATITTSLD